MNASILIVEDEEALTLLLRYNRETQGYEVETIARGDEADTRLIAARHRLDLVALRFEVVAQQQRQSFLVLNDQNAGIHSLALLLLPR